MLHYNCKHTQATGTTEDKESALACRP